MFRLAKYPRHFSNDLGNAVGDIGGFQQRGSRYCRGALGDKRDDLWFSAHGSMMNSTRGPLGQRIG